MSIIPASNSVLQTYDETQERSSDFLSSFFVTDRQSFFNTKDVVLDIRRRYGRKVATVIPTLFGGYQDVQRGRFETKRFEPPVYKLRSTINADHVFERRYGQNPFSDTNALAWLSAELFSQVRAIEDSIRRGQELQAAQVFQTGVVNLVDDLGRTTYTLDCDANPLHFPTVTTSWGEAGANPTEDVGALLQTIADTNESMPDQLICGSRALTHLLDQVKGEDAFEFRRMDQGQIARKPAGFDTWGGQYIGILNIYSVRGVYGVDLWSYTGTFEDPVTGVETPYLDPDRVIARSSTGLLQTKFGACPDISELLGNDPSIPSRLNAFNGRIPRDGADLWSKVWRSEDRSSITVGVASRPLMFPTNIDSFGSLLTRVP